MSPSKAVLPAVIVRLLGGLGNQMFQYSLGRALSIRHGVPLKLDLSVLQDHRKGLHEVNRNYELGIFCISAGIASRADIAPYHPFGARLPGKIWFHLRGRLWGTDAVNEEGYLFDPSVFDLKPPLYLAGLWQSYHYFAEIESELRGDFRFVADLPVSNSRILGAITLPNAVCLHVRRSDYVNAQSAAQSLGFVGIDYYRRAVQVAKYNIPDACFFVFSDDLDWCEANLGFLDRVVFARYEIPEGITRQACDMQIMSKARNFILANSTFSWWSAWLAGPDARTIIVPRQWFKDTSLSSVDLVLPGWIQA